MVEKKSVLSFNYYTYGQAFTGSDAGKRYRLIKAEREEKKEVEEGKESEKRTVLQVSVWKEPFCYEKTPSEEIIEQDFDFSEEGLSLAVDYINETSV